MTEKTHLKCVFISHVFHEKHTSDWEKNTKYLFPIYPCVFKFVYYNTLYDNNDTKKNNTIKQCLSPEGKNSKHSNGPNEKSQNTEMAQSF